jgi:glycosyltransferase involved in cell wall biosynthesis
VVSSSSREIEARALRTLALVSARPPAPTCPRPVRVGVLVDLAQGPRAGGHVRCWERLAEAALGFAESLDLTVHFMGERAARRQLGRNVRFVLEPPVFSTERLRFLGPVPDHTDLARWHPRLARMLLRYDVIHATDAYFAYARTALRIGRRHGIPIVNSVHTNTPEYARIFTGLTIERLFGEGMLSRLLLDHLGVARRVERRMLAQLSDYQRNSAFTLVSRPEQLEPARARLQGRAALLRRGIDHRLFQPGKRDRRWLALRYGIPIERFVVICAGRLNRGKNVLFLADAVAALAALGVDAHLICAGDGPDRPVIRDRLSGRATCPGVVEPGELARLYASADLFAFPSRIEEAANVVLESQASGLPALVTREGGMGRAIADGRTGLILAGDDLQAWVEAIRMLAGNAERRWGMARAARRHAERNVPSWAEVLSEDLLPHWVEAAMSQGLRTRNA